MKTLRIMPLIIAAAISFTACEKDEDLNSNSSEINQSPNSFKVKMTDAPGDYAALDVEITGVEVFHEELGWVNLNNEAQYVNVLDLTNGAETDLAFKGNVEAGAYSKVKIVFGDQNTLKLKGDLNVGGVSGSNETMVQLQWNQPKEVIIEIDENVSAFNSAEVLLDFQVAQSIQENFQEYILAPSIELIEDASTGIQGEVEGSANAAVFLTNGADTLSTYIDAEGKFMIRGVESGIYDLIIEPTEDKLMGALDQFEMNQVLISEGKIKQVGTINL